MAPDGPEMGEIVGEVTVKIDRLATGGEGVGRMSDGMVVFVPDAAPGDVVSVELTDRKKRFARGRVTAVSSPATRGSNRRVGMWRRAVVAVTGSTSLRLGNWS